MPERDLDTLLRLMAPHLHPQTYVYCCVADGHVPPGLEPICTFREDEGLTLIVEKEQAECAQLAFTFESRRITLTVNSALEAVGFLAAVSARLAAAGISCNAVAGYHHDHLFVPAVRAEEALAVLALKRHCWRD